MGLRARLTLLSALGIAVLCALALVTLNVMLGRQTEQRLDREMVEQVSALRSALASASSSAELLPLSRDFLAGPASEPLRLSGLILLVSVDGAGVVSNSSDVKLEELALPSSAAGGAPASVWAAGGWYRVAEAPILFAGKTAGYIRVAAPMQEALAARRQVILLVAILLACGTVLISLGAWVLVGRALAPVRRIAESAAEISHRDLEKRVPYEGPADDIGQLAGTVNGMLDRLESAFAEQEAFISGVSHELRTPLTIAKGHLQVLDRREGLTEEVRAEHAVVLDELDRMNRLVDELLTLARSGRTDFLRPEWIDVDALLTGLISQGPLLAEDREWRASPLPGGRLSADQDRLTQVFLNLMQNAVAHTRPGQSITLGGRATLDGLELWVADTGQGMPEETRKHIFERFFRGAGDQAAAGTGLGLGLSIAEAIVRAHEGTISVQSALGSGSIFRISMPGFRYRTS